MCCEILSFSSAFNLQLYRLFCCRLIVQMEATRSNTLSSVYRRHVYEMCGVNYNYIHSLYYHRFFLFHRSRGKLKCKSLVARPCFCTGTLSLSVQVPHAKGSHMLPVLDTSIGSGGVNRDNDINITYVLLHFLLGKCTFLRKWQKLVHFAMALWENL